MPNAQSLPGVNSEPGAATGQPEWLDGPGRLLLAAIAALTLVHGLVAAFAGLTEDEAYYRLWALSPAMSYLDHPPMVGWMIAVGRWIAGDNPFGIRLLALAGSLLGPFVLWRTARILFGPVVARRAVWFALAMPLLAVGSVVMTPDAPSVLFWGLAGWALAELYVSQRADWWLAFGLFAGLGLLSKYTNLFVGAGVLLWLVLLPGNWHWFRSWQLWAGGAIAALLTLPVVVWNANHGWASFAKQFGRVASGTHFTLTYFFELVGGYIGLASPLIAVLGAGRPVAGRPLSLDRARPGPHPGGAQHAAAARLHAAAYPARSRAGQLGRAALSGVRPVRRHRRRRDEAAGRTAAGHA